MAAAPPSERRHPTRRLLTILVLLAGCQQLPLTPEDSRARKFETVPDRAVIYLVRDTADFSDAETPVLLGNVQVKTNAGTYYRWVVPAGKHTISGFGADAGSITLQVERGRIYFVQQSVMGTRVPSSTFQTVSEAAGRAAVQRSVLVAPR